MPRRLDRFLAESGFESQQTDEPEDPDREDNLREPVAGDFGARGRFDDRARARSYQLWAATHRRTVALLAGLLAAVAAALGRRLVGSAEDG